MKKLIFFVGAPSGAQGQFHYDSAFCAPEGAPTNLMKLGKLSEIYF